MNKVKYGLIWVKVPVFLLLCLLASMPLSAQVLQSDMEAVFNEVRTPYKYGMVVVPADNYHKIDCPTVFRESGRWYMTYVVYNGKDGLDGRGYETWLASSDDLLSWTTEGCLLAYRNDSTLWDCNQRGGFPSLIDWTWGGSYEMKVFKGRHWMTYIGGKGTGYEAVRAPLNIGLAWTKNDITTAHEWESMAERPLLSIDDKDVQWWEKLVQYKSTVYQLDKSDQKVLAPLSLKTKHPRFLMYYNAGGVNPGNALKAERIGIAVSNDMRRWERYSGNPIYYHEAPGIITGDAQIVRMDNITNGGLYVMFYFSAYNPERKYNAYNTFAVSRDLIHWQDWTGDDLIIPSKEYDDMFAHKSYVVKHDGVVYHFYCAVNKAGQRGIAVATSLPLGRSAVNFPQPEKTGRRTVTNLNDSWTTTLLADASSQEGSSFATKPSTTDTSFAANETAQLVNLPHNWDDYYGYRQLKHGNLHGSARYAKSFSAEKQPGRRYFLQFEGIGSYATVTLNGTTWPRTPVGRTTYTIDVTDALQNDNALTVVTDHPAMITDMPWVCGGCSSEWGFSEGSQPLGIFRPVSLVETADVRIEPFGVHIWNNNSCDSVFIDTEVKNYSTLSRTIEIVNKLAKSSGKTAFRITEKVTLQPGEIKSIRQSSPIDDPQLWSIENPYLYTLSSMVKDEQNKTIDETTTEFGVRSVSWPVLRAKGDSTEEKTGDNRFYLNGKPVFINGTCEYEHLLGNSHAFTPEQIRSRVKQIRNAGFNAFREAHQPHNLLYQQLFDEQGMLFWSQFSAHIWYDTPAFRNNFKRLLRQWIRERRNSPSIILWGLQNESVLPKDFAEECCEIIREMDPTARTMRAITTCNGGEGSDWNVIQNWSGTYGGSADNYDNELKRPDQLLNGEYGAWRTIDLHGKAKYSEESFAKLLETKARLAEEAKDSVCGHFQWLFTSHDNPGRVQPDGAYRRIDKLGPINYKGLTTIWEEPTIGYDMYRKRYAVPADTLIPTAADRNIDLVKGAVGWDYLYRINCGGDDYVDEFGQLWTHDSQRYSHSWGADFDSIHPYQGSQRHITTFVHGTQSQELFQYFRFGRHRLWYDFKVPEGDYRVELYFMEPWHGKGGGEPDALSPFTGKPVNDFEGLRIFDVAINGTTVVDNLDLWAEAGYCGAFKRVVYAKADDGRLCISFPEVKAGQAVICAIAIASQSYSTKSNIVASLASDSSFSWKAFDTDTISKLPPALLPQDTESRMATTYQPSKPGQFVIKPGLGQEYALRFKYKNTTGQAVKGRLTITDSKRIVLVDRNIDFPTTPNKFKTLSTTTETQINAGTYTVRVEAKGVELKELEIQ